MKQNAFHILVLDDEPPILQLYRNILSVAPAGIHFDLTCCARAKEAVETVQQAKLSGRPFSVAFLDIRMSDGPDGLWAAEEIRKLDQRIGIVMVTGDAGVRIDEVERRVPPPDKLFYLEKPFKTKEIRQFSLALCARREAELELARIHGHLEAMVAERTMALMAANEELKTEVKNRLETEKALRISRENFSSMILENPDGIIIFDTDQIARFINPAAEEMLQRKAEDVIGISLGYPLVEDFMTRRW